MDPIEAKAAARRSKIVRLVERLIILPHRLVEGDGQLEARADQ